MPRLTNCWYKCKTCNYNFDATFLGVVSCCPNCKAKPNPNWSNFGFAFNAECLACNEIQPPPPSLMAPLMCCKCNGRQVYTGHTSSKADWIQTTDSISTTNNTQNLQGCPVGSPGPTGPPGPTAPPSEPKPSLKENPFYAGKWKW